eukprot:UN06365
MSLSSVDEQLANATLIADDLWQQNSKFRRDKSLKLLRKIYTNIKNHANEAKYRKLNMSKISSKANIVPQVRQILLCSGFVANGDGVHAVLTDNNLHLCLAVGVMMEERINDEIVKLEQEREKIKQRTKQKQIELANENNKKRELVKKQINCHKKAKSKQCKPKISSKAKKLNFGAKNVKVEFKTS